MPRFYDLDPRNPDHIDRSGARSEPAEAIAHRLCGHLLRDRRRLERIVAPREPRGEHRRVSAPGSVRGTGGVALARELDEALPVEEHVDRLLAVTAGDDDRLGAKRVDGARERFGIAGLLYPCERDRLGHVRRRDGRPRQQQLDQRAAGVVVSSSAPDSATITGSSTTGVVVAGARSSAAATAPRSRRRRAFRS